MSICIEKKLTLSGKVYLFECELLLLNSGLGVLKYVIDREYTVDGIKLHPGDITHALYWMDRPYTLYIWHLSRDRVVHYFNIADRISLQPREFLWRDLAVDIVIDNECTVRVLDEDELPDNLEPALSRYIQNAKATIMRDYASIIHEANVIVSRLP
jgi:Protein of unknown function (DUF402)